MGEGLKTLKNNILGTISVAIGLFISISIATYDIWDKGAFTYSSDQPQNYGGIAGAYISDVLFSVIGISTYFIPVFIFGYSLKRLTGRDRIKSNLPGSLLFMLAISMISTLLSDTFHVTSGAITGGLIGHTLITPIVTLLSPVGGYIVSLTVLVSSIIVLSPVSQAISLKRDKKVLMRPVTFQKHPIQVVENTVEIVEETDQEIEPKIAEAKFPELQKGVYMLPPISFLSPPPSKEQQMSKEELLNAATILQSKLLDFGVQGKIMQIHPGPVITMFEFEPSPGIKISKVVSLSDDLGRAMGGLKVRVTLIPGKTPIGIEVPNINRAVVSLKEIIDSDSFNKKKSLLTLTLGKDIYGTPVSEDLARMPHLLVAGTTGSGKSVSVNSMIMSILYKARPTEVKMLMIDPKLLELSIYEGIPHLISPVITNPKEATEALKKMVMEMDRRYRLIADSGARNIETFNAHVEDEQKLPFIIIIIDELADLMFTSSKSVEDSIVRLAQMARAAGIHLILATQRPSVDVITGIIKANFPSRIAFQVSSKVDSRTILDTHGAEKLLGRGDMLLLNPGARIIRLHGAYVSEDEI
ncbi:MAG: DNA translocase FtsK 4TM domain-containing protein, partial [Nitrospirae bacterium]|nr:DNA translocase FtsK 4TM domain-containing protein [Nitrospirota bacterium]